MTLFKDRLPNDNVVIWFGTEDNDLINNAMILAGGDVLIFKGIHKIESNKFEIKNDLMNMEIQDFIDEYGLFDVDIIKKNLEFDTINFGKLKNKIFEIMKDLKDGLLQGSYPPYITKYNDRVNDNKWMISKYLNNISNTSNSGLAINHLLEIILKCERKIQNLLRQHIKIEERNIKEIEQNKKSPLKIKLLEIQKDTKLMVNFFKNKVHKILEEVKELGNY